MHVDSLRSVSYITTFWPVQAYFRFRSLVLSFPVPLIFWESCRRHRLITDSSVFRVAGLSLFYRYKSESLKEKNSCCRWYMAFPKSFRIFAGVLLQQCALDAGNKADGWHIAVYRMSFCLKHRLVLSFYEKLNRTTGAISDKLVSYLVCKGRLIHPTDGNGHLNQVYNDVEI